MAKSAAEVIAESLGWDAAEVRDYRYQRYVNPVVYAIGERYFAAHVSKPRHDVGGAWEAHSDQFGARGTDRIIWVSKAV